MIYEDVLRAFAEEGVRYLIVGGSASVQINAASIEDLIALKKSSGRPRDIEDIAHVRKVLEIRKRMTNGT